jgi:hypothetical protein
VVQVVEWLPSKCKSLSPNLTTSKKKRKKRKKEKIDRGEPQKNMNSYVWVAVPVKFLFSVYLIIVF